MISQKCAHLLFIQILHIAYKDIIDKLPESLVKRAYQSLLNHSKNPIPLEMISGNSD
ncbi:hypothetical protein RhiirA1_469127 [Rhizophagus irregularis]|uniref:Uncharacterized protein n=1 Tax=Rhizophagus irregularis TaxID=588596 RepID=A0A2N0R8N3_9GLOM|nr:hypothetical protein RhiirA1_469127 [Rhizophagus irregularis]GET49953.1 hypothetical protein RIR_e67330_A0A2N0R8N3_9GLOM [Rhizophagus irregularis DAOM 181602=DAOM 197198]